MLLRVKEGVLLNNDSRERGINCDTLKRIWYLITSFHPRAVLSVPPRGFAMRLLGCAAPREEAASPRAAVRSQPKTPGGHLIWESFMPPTEIQVLT